MDIRNGLFTSEYVSEGHPDRVADQISDTVVDLFLAKDPNARVACETLVTTNTVIIAGETKAVAQPTSAEIESAIRGRVAEIGYEQAGFNHATFAFTNLLHAQSADISQGVDQASGQTGAGDQGIMFGYASNETPNLMPAAIYYAKRVLDILTDWRNGVGVVEGGLSELGSQVLLPDAKSQITLRYENGVPVEVDAIVISHQHIAEVSQEEVGAVLRAAAELVIPLEWLTDNTKWYLNPTGQFIIGGPDGDTGVTGRKIIVNTYGGAAPHGGGAFSGKDYTKVDRSAAYAARYIAKNIVAANIADQCTVQLAYAIGVPEPVGLNIYLQNRDLGVPQPNVDELAAFILTRLSLTPAGIQAKFDLKRPIYTQTAAKGHFGFPHGTSFAKWENLDLAPELVPFAPAR